MAIVVSSVSAQVAPARPTVVLESAVARLAVDLGGGSIGEFRFKDHAVNPLSWSTPASGDVSVRGFGHFLCLDRWGPPSDAEGAKGMPYHGEASNVSWQPVGILERRGEAVQAQFAALLPRAGLSVRRTIRLSDRAAICAVREEVTNENALGRLYNMVQHPAIAPPFLDESTIVDCNGRRGFAQGGRLPNPEEPSFTWPRAIRADGQSVDMTRLTNAPEPNVVSYAIEADHGWVTAVTPAQGLLIGYVWKTRDYPWVSLWREVHEGRPAARGLEFGTTGLHQPFAILVQKGRIWDRPLFEYLDAGATAVRRYFVFLLRVPADFAGVGAIDVNRDALVLSERGPGQPRRFTVSLEGLVAD